MDSIQEHSNEIVQDSSFLRLPTEVRLLILGFVLRRPNTHGARWNGDNDFYEDGHPYCPVYCDTSGKERTCYGRFSTNHIENRWQSLGIPGPGIISACRQLYQEGAPIFYGENTFGLLLSEVPQPDRLPPPPPQVQVRIPVLQPFAVPLETLGDVHPALELISSWTLHFDFARRMTPYQHWMVMRSVVDKILSKCRTIRTLFIDDSLTQPVSKVAIFPPLALLSNVRQFYIAKDVGPQAVQLFQGRLGERLGSNSGLSPGQKTFDLFYCLSGMSKNSEEFIDDQLQGPMDAGELDKFPLVSDEFGLSLRPFAARLLAMIPPDQVEDFKKLAGAR